MREVLFDSLKFGEDFYWQEKHHVRVSYGKAVRLHDDEFFVIDADKLTGQIVKVED